MARTLKITEGTPTAYPAVTTPVHAPTEQFLASIWQRIEAYIRFRWAERSCIFIVEGPGEWASPLEPATVTATDLWNSSDAWETVTLRAAPFGGYDLASGIYQITATVGSTDEPPAAVLEAFSRLAQYMNMHQGDSADAKASAIQDVGSVEYWAPNIAARAMQYSGAGDLLRPYRKLGAC